MNDMKNGNEMCIRDRCMVVSALDGILIVCQIWVVLHESDMIYHSLRCLFCNWFLCSFLFVEESRIFGGKRGQDKVVALLRDNINRVANQYGWNMVISAKLMSVIPYAIVPPVVRMFVC